MSAQQLLADLRTAVAEYKKAEASCPVNSGLGCPARCPKCGATRKEACGEIGLAMWPVIKAAIKIIATEDGK